MNKKIQKELEHQDRAAEATDLNKARFGGLGE